MKAKINKTPSGRLIRDRVVRNLISETRKANSKNLQSIYLQVIDDLHKLEAKLNHEQTQ